jgi:hypothetical protein
MKPASPASIALLVILSSIPTQASVVFFTDRASFNAAAGFSGAPDESFEVSVSGSPSIDFGLFTVTESGADVSNFLDTGLSSLATDGLRTLGYGRDTGPTSVTFSFDSPINAFGLDIGTGDFLPPFPFTVSGDISHSFSTQSQSSLQFFGVIDSMNSFDTLTFGQDGAGGEIEMDSLSFGAIPEPSTGALLSIAALLGIGYRRKNRKAAV